jgi:alpha-L-rhamnosidase
VSQACRAAGDDTGADRYERLFEQIKAAFNQRYVQADGQIQGGSQCAYAMALQFNLLPDSLRAMAARNLADNVASHRDHLTTGFVGVSYLLPALSSENQVAASYRLLLQDTFPSWLFSVKHGATTIWERWDGWTPEQGFQNPSMNSFNHYSLGSCGEWMFDTVAGIGTDGPGFRHIMIRPRPGGGLTRAEGSFDSIRGRIATKWTLENGLFTLHATIPVNTVATLELPTSDPSSVYEGEQKAADSDLKFVPGSRNVQFLVGSGDYLFTCKAP